jgi:hypothetical protein
LDRAASERPELLQLMAAEIELARGDYARASLAFARATSSASTRAEAQRGLAAAFRAAAMPELTTQ